MRISSGSRGGPGPRTFPRRGGSLPVQHPFDANGTHPQQPCRSRLSVARGRTGTAEGELQAIAVLQPQPAQLVVALVALVELQTRTERDRQRSRQSNLVQHRIDLLVGGLRQSGAIE